MPAVLYTQELAWSPAIYVKDSPRLQKQVQNSPSTDVNGCYSSAYKFSSASQYVICGCLRMNVCSLFVPNQPLWHCHRACKTNSCSLLAHRGVLPSKTQIRTCIQTIQAVARRQPAWISYYFIFSWLYQDKILSQIKTSTLDIAHEYKNCSCNVPP